MKIPHVLFVAAIVVALSAPPAAQAAPTSTAAPAHWFAAWYSPPFPPTSVLTWNDVRIFDHQTVRQVLRLEAGGDRLRVRLTNELGLSPVKIGSVHIALSSPNGVTEPETDHQVTFEGHPDATIPTEQALVSDPINMKTHAFDEVAISIYYPGRLAPAAHLTLVKISGHGDHGSEAILPSWTIARAPALASGVDVETDKPRHVIVAFGDSITEGAGVTPGLNLAWPEQLALRLSKDPATENLVVINSGISGNRLLHDGAGPKALDRFERDALDIPGVTDIILLEGINDIGWAYSPDGDTGPLSVDDIIGAYKELIARAHASGLKIFAGTMTPYEGAVYYSLKGEEVREAVNKWIRTSGAFDGVIDFDSALRDPAHPLRFIGAYQFGDNLHPNDAGNTAMAEAIDLKLFADPSGATAPTVDSPTDTKPAPTKPTYACRVHKDKTGHRRRICRRLKPPAAAKTQR